MDDIPHTVRVSAKAKRVILRVLPLKGLEVVVPRGFDTRRVPAILRSNRGWIDKHLSRIPEPGARELLPRLIRFPAVDTAFLVAYESGYDGGLVLQERGPRDIVLRGPRPEELPEACADLLGEWLKRQGGYHLLPWLERVAADLGLGYSRATVRCQKTRWGSCSRKNAISLNCKLLFLPPRLVHQVLIHELCHTRHHDHSRRFWGLVARSTPDYARREKELKRAWRHIPAWVR
jgi:hypothetical protein